MVSASFFELGSTHILMQSLYLQKSRHSATSATFVPKYAKEDIVRSGHIEYDTLYASNEREVLYAAANNYAAGNYAASNILSQVETKQDKTWFSSRQESLLFLSLLLINFPQSNSLLIIFIIGVP